MKPMYKKGFSLIEAVVYIGVITVMTGILTSFVFEVMKIHSYTQVAQEVIDNAKRGGDIIAQEVRHAKSVYAPTSVLNTSFGQLSLETTRNIPSGDDRTYVDFYVDDERLFLKREGMSPFQLTTDRVKVTNLIFRDIAPTSVAPAVRIELTLAYDAPLVEAVRDTSITLLTTASLRAY